MAKAHLSLILLFIILLSCEQEANIKMPPVKEKLVINSFISPQDTVLKVFVGKTTPLFGTKTPGSEDNWWESIKGSVVVISDGSQSIQLNYDSISGNYISHVNELRIQTGRQYFLEVSALGQKVTSSCVIPEATDINSIQLDSVEERMGPPEFPYVYTFLEVTATWKDGFASKNYYKIYGEIEFEKERSPNYPQSKYSPFFFEKDLIVDVEDGTGDFSRKSKVENYDADVKTSKIHIYLLTVDKNYYTYHKWFRNNDDENPFVEPTLVPTNIEGGLGVFAGFNKTDFVFEIK